MNTSSGAKLPTVLVVGEQKLADYLAGCGALWKVFPAAATVDDLWNNIESGVFPNDSDVIVFTDGTGSVVDELESSAAAFAPYSEVFIVATPSRGEAIIGRAKELASTVDGGDPSRPIHLMPSNDLQEAMRSLRDNTATIVEWNVPGVSGGSVAPAPVVVPPVAEPVPQVSVQPVPPTVPPDGMSSQFGSGMPMMPAVAPAAQFVAPPPVSAPGQPQFGSPVPPPVSAPVPPAGDASAQFMPPSPPASASPVQQPPVQVSPVNQVSAAGGYDQNPYYAPHVAEQATQEYEKPDNAVPGNITIAVMSSKGGSGKSTTALSLAGTIAKSSAAAGDPKRVVVVDLDTRDGQIGSLIGQYMPTAVNIRVLPRWDAVSVKQNLVYDKRLGVDALLAPVRPRNADDVGPEFYRQIIEVLQSTHDVVILDCSVNYLDPLLGVAFGLSDEILFVTTLAATSVQGMARALHEMFAAPEDGGIGIPREKVGVVANQVINNVNMGKNKMLKAALGAPLVGEIPAEQDAVLVATNTNRMDELLTHVRLGPAYFRLASTCLPGWRLEPLVAVGTAHPNPAVPPTAVVEEERKKRSFFGR